MYRGVLNLDLPSGTLVGDKNTNFVPVQDTIRILRGIFTEMKGWLKPILNPQLGTFRKSSKWSEKSSKAPEWQGSRSTLPGQKFWGSGPSPISKFNATTTCNLLFQSNLPY